MKKGFTLIELLVVMGVMAVLIGLGGLGLSNFGSSSELRNSELEIITVLQDAQNRARNSIAYGIDETTSTPLIPDYYAVDLSENVASILGCFAQADSSVLCNNVQNRGIISEYQNIFVESTCELVAFRRISLDMYSIDSQGQFIDASNCSVIITHANITGEREILIDFELNNITTND